MDRDLQKTCVFIDRDSKEPSLARHCRRERKVSMRSTQVSMRSTQVSVTILRTGIEIETCKIDICVADILMKDLEKTCIFIDSDSKVPS